MKQTINYSFKEVETELAGEIGALRARLANERAQKRAIIKYAEELEQENEKLKEDIKKAKSDLAKLATSRQKENAH